ncbi:MAG: hypothetical protein BGO52_12725 [Sphingobacteriales bacterium 44-61]|nr:MAG: hypothetical protein BGO52_12725 [Sphingobacteriales bacterium 44-61]
MIVIALIVPYIGGMVEVVLSIAAITAGPLLAPPIWALFSKYLTGRASLWITLITLLINLLFKLVFPYTLSFKLNRAEEMMTGVGLPLLLLLGYELYRRVAGKVADDYLQYTQNLLKLKQQKAALNSAELYAIRRQNYFGLRVITFSLFFTSAMLAGLSFITANGRGLTATVAGAIFISALIPWLAARRMKRSIGTQTPGN